MKRVVFRVEANAKIGRGHISRCLAIADMLQNELAILFVFLRSNQNFIVPILKDYKFKSLEKEGDLTALLHKEDFLWIDGYDFTEAWKKQMRPLVQKLIETNDIPYPADNVDITVNHTPNISKQQFGPIGKDTQLYLGLKYALLRQRFLKKAQASIASNKGNGVFICFGGADTYDLGKKFVFALLQQNFTDSIYWVTNKLDQDIKNQTAKNLHLLSNLNEEEMIYYMTKAKVILIPSSVLSFEAMALRKPIFTCFFVDNQALIYQGLVQQELATGVGYLENENDVAHATSSFLTYYDDEKLQINQINRQKKVLDGKSGERIKNIIL